MQISPFGGKTFVTRLEIQEFLGVSRSTFYRLVAEGKLPEATYHFSARIKRWLVREVLEAIERMRTSRGDLHDAE